MIVFVWTVLQEKAPWSCPGKSQSVDDSLFGGVVWIDDRLMALHNQLGLEAGQLTRP